MRAALALTLLAAAAAGEPSRLLEGHSVATLVRSGDGVWVSTDRGLFLVERYSIRRLGPEGARPAIEAGPAGAVYAGFGEAAVERVALVRPDGGYDWVEGASFRAGVYKTRVELHGEIWRASENGIERERKTPRFRRHRIPNSDRAHALAAGADGSIWCGTQDGVARLHPDGRFEGLQKGLGLVTAIEVDREGRVWIGSGSAFSGVMRNDGAGFKTVEGIGAYVHSIAMDPSGTLWFAALNVPGGAESEGRGAWFWTDEGFRRADWLGSQRVYDVAARDPRGVLWFATLKGLVAYEGEGRVVHYTPTDGEITEEKVWCLSAASDGSLWLGYQKGGGASRLARGSLSHFGSADGMCSDDVWAVTEGRRGEIWFATSKGLSRYDGRRWSCFRFTEAGLWPLLPRPDGSLWIGSLGDGLWQLVPDDHEAPRTTRIERDGNRFSWEGVDAWFDTPSEDLWYRWRLDGGRWSAASPATRAEVAFPPGAHAFAVQAIDRFGNAQDPPALLRFVIESPFAIAPWMLLVAIAVVAIGLLVLRRGS